MWWWATDGNGGANRSIGASMGDVGQEGGVWVEGDVYWTGVESDGRWSMGSTVNLEVGRR